MSGAFWANHIYSGELAGIGGYTNANVQLRNFWRVSVMHEINSEYLETAILRGGPAMMTSARSQSFVQVTSDQRKKLFVSGTVNRAFDPNGEFDQRVFGLGVTYRPTGRSTCRSVLSGTSVIRACNTSGQPPARPVRAMSWRACSSEP